MIQYDVVWDGRRDRHSLIPDREEHWDTRYAGMPSMDIDMPPTKRSKCRKYTLSGKYKGIFGRTNPAAKQFKLTKEKG